VYAPVKLVASRLTRKLPPRPVRSTREMAECARCGGPLRGGRCGPCAPPSRSVEDRLRAEVARAGRARVRAALA
jgi:hypothetical protein